MVQIADPEDCRVTISVEYEGHNPDVLDDIQARVIDLYRKTIAFRIALGVAEVATEEDVPDEQ